MPKLTGNKGEWSEIYSFLRLLNTGKLYAADKDLNKIDNVFYNIVKIIRQEKIGELEFIYDKNSKYVTVKNVFGEEIIASVSIDDLKYHADKLYSEIIHSEGSVFTSETTEDFLRDIGISTLKAKSNDKADIHIKIHDINSGYEAVQGFSIKSRLGNPSTLINAGRTTNFIYEVMGSGINDDVMNEYNYSGLRFVERLKILANSQCYISYYDMANVIFKNNLMLIDGDLPKIISEMLIKYYVRGITNISSLIDEISSDNPMNYDLSMGHPFYSYKLKKILSECALGMTPGKPWSGKADATGGYIIVREDGEVLCYHLFNRNEFEDYLFSNTKFETASTSRHGFGQIYKVGDRYFINLNLQVRFIK